MKRFVILLAILLSVAVAPPAGAAEKIGIVLMHGKLGASLGSASGRRQIGGRLIAALQDAGCWGGRYGSVRERRPQQRTHGVQHLFDE